jgi:predicted nucleic acid-binding protein
VTSRPIKSVAADSNALLSAVAGRAARRIFAKAADLIVVTTADNIDEVEEYLPEFAERYKLDRDLLVDVLGLLPVEIYSEAHYITHLSEARKLLSSRDPDDVALAALALKLQIPVWSNDNDYRGFPFGCFTTAQLIKALGI